MCVEAGGAVWPTAEPLPGRRPGVSAAPVAVLLEWRQHVRVGVRVSVGVGGAPGLGDCAV